MVCQGTLLPFHPCNDDLGKHRKYEEALELKDEWKGVCQTKLVSRIDSAELIIELLKGRFGMEVAWRLEMEEGWLSLRMGRDLAIDALRYQAFNQLWIGSSPFPIFLGRIGQLIVSWYCVHGCTCMYVEEKLTRTD